MGGHPDAVADAVDEVLAVAGVGDHLARGAVDLLARDPRPHRLEGGLLGLADDVVDLSAPRSVGASDVHGAGRVGPVAVLEAAEVEHDHVALLDRALAHLVMRVGAVGPGAHDGEVDLRVAVLAQQAGEIGGDLALGAPGELDADDLLEARVGGGARRGEALEFVVALDGPQHRQRVRSSRRSWTRAACCCRPSRCIAHAESEIA